MIYIIHNYYEEFTHVVWMKSVNFKAQDFNN